MSRATLHCGDAIEVLRTMPAESVRCCVTSPPYWGLRDYGVAGQLGLEASPQEYVARMVEVFQEVRRVLMKDGTLWVNMGDSYADGGRGGDSGSVTLQGSRRNQEESRKVSVRQSFRRDKMEMPRQRRGGLKPKDMLMMPARMALALQEDGWYLRSDIIWRKPNAMPESVNDRPTKAHEYVFLLSKSKRYFYDGAAISEPLSPDTHARVARGRSNNHKWADGGPGDQTIAKGAPSAGRKQAPANEELIKSNERFARATTELKGKYSKQPSGWDTSNGGRHDKTDGRYTSGNKERQRDQNGVTSDRGRHVPWTADEESRRNARTVWDIPYALTDAQAVLELMNAGAGEGDLWTISSQGYPGAHFATFPEELARRCIAAGSQPGDSVLDPFGGSGTTIKKATDLSRHGVYIDLNPSYLELAKARVGPLLCEVPKWSA